MIKAVIDIGSNSIKMRIAKIINGRIHVLHDETDAVRLGSGISALESESEKILSEESMKNSCTAVAKMVKNARRAGAEIFIVGTMALRTAKNSDLFLKMIFDSTGHEVHVLSGEDEAKYSWFGAVDGFNLDGDAVVFDSGGGSTEFVLGSDSGVKKIISVPVGAVNLSERFFYEHETTIKKSSYDSAVEYVKNLFLEYKLDEFKSDASQIIGVGGGVVTLASVKFACESFVPSKLHGSVLTQRDIIKQIKMYAALTLSERENIIGLPASRADIILGSACIVLTALKIFNAPSCIVSINGLRHGLLYDNV